MGVILSRSNVRYYNIKNHLSYIIMSVKLTSFSKPVDETQSLQDLVAYCARVSNPANQNNTQTNEKLIRYLIKNNHWSPLEMVSVCLEIETTRDIARQILRHRSFSFQEFSQRYAVADLGFECKEARLQDKKNRQNSIQTDNTDLQNEWEAQQKRVADNAQSAYKWALDNGIAKEQARAVLPEGMTLSRMYMNGTLRSWVHYISLRSGNGTQKEHRDIAMACAKAIEPIFPMINEFITQGE
jgi:thymidylate synthase (FAD)